MNQTRTRAVFQPLSKHTTMTLSPAVPAIQKKKWRIPKKSDVVFRKIRQNESLTKEQDEYADYLLQQDQRNVMEVKHKFRRLLFGMRLMHDSIFLEEGEILE